jgi:hypothetical protein
MDHHQMSERRSYKAMGFCQMTIRSETRRSDDHVRERMKALAHERRRFGYRRFMCYSGVSDKQPHLAGLRFVGLRHKISVFLITRIYVYA